MTASVKPPGGQLADQRRPRRPAGPAAGRDPPTGRARPAPRRRRAAAGRPPRRAARPASSPGRRPRRWRVRPGRPAARRPALSSRTARQCLLAHREPLPARPVPAGSSPVIMRTALSRSRGDPHADQLGRPGLRGRHQHAAGPGRARRLDVGADVADHHALVRGHAELGRRRPAPCQAPGLRQPHPSLSPCGHSRTASNGPSSASTRAFTASASARLNQPAGDARLVGDHRRPAVPCRRAARTAAAAPGIGSTSAGIAVVGHVADQRAVPVEQHRPRPRGQRPGPAGPDPARAASASSASSGMTRLVAVMVAISRAVCGPGDDRAPRRTPRCRPARPRAAASAARAGRPPPAPAAASAAAGDQDVARAAPPGRPGPLVPAGGRAAPASARRRRCPPGLRRLTQGEAGRTGCTDPPPAAPQLPAVGPQPQGQVGVFAEGARGTARRSRRPRPARPAGRPCPR